MSMEGRSITGKVTTMIGMMTGTRNNYVKKIVIKNRDGSNAGTITITKSKPKKQKKVQYNFKYVSNQVLQSKTSVNAKQAATTAKGYVALLRRKLYSGDYDTREVRHALVHAEKIARVAKKKWKHLREEELGKKGGICQGDLEENDKKKDPLGLDELTGPDLLKMGEDKMKELMQELEAELQELERELSSGSLGQLSDELMPVSHREMDPEDLDLLKKKHRSEELREIMEADMKYLKALFNRLAREKEEGPGGQDYGSNDYASGVSLEIGGLDIPVETVEAPVLIEGSNFDVMT